MRIQASSSENLSLPRYALHLLMMTSRLAIKYQFLTNDSEDSAYELQVDPFNAVQELNDYEVRRNTPGSRAPCEN